MISSLFSVVGSISSNFIYHFDLHLKIYIYKMGCQTKEEKKREGWTPSFLFYLAILMIYKHNNDNDKVRSHFHWSFFLPIFLRAHRQPCHCSQECKVLNQGENQRYDLCLRCLAIANEASKSDPTIDSGCPSSCR